MWKLAYISRDEEGEDFCPLRLKGASKCNWRLGAARRCSARKTTKSLLNWMRGDKDNAKQAAIQRKEDRRRKREWQERNAIWPEGTSLQTPLEITSISPSLASSSRKINAISSFSESLGRKSLRVKREQRYNAWASACAPTQRRRQIIAAAAPTTTIGQEAEKNRAILKEAQKFVETTDKANWSLSSSSSSHPPLDQFVGTQLGIVLNARGKKKLQQLKYWKRMSPSQIKIYPNDPHVTHLCWLRDHEDWRELVGGQLKARYGLRTRQRFARSHMKWRDLGDQWGELAYSSEEIR